MAGPSKARFQQVFTDGRRVSGDFFRISSLPGSGLVGFATAKSFGSKPLRNRQRRRAQACYRAQNGPADLDLVIMVQNRAGSAGSAELCNEMAELLVRTKAQWAERSESS